MCQELLESFGGRGYVLGLGRILIVREYYNDVQKLVVVEGNHRARAVQLLHWTAVPVTVVSAPDGMYYCLLVCGVVLILFKVTR